MGEFVDESAEVYSSTHQAIDHDSIYSNKISESFSKSADQHSIPNTEVYLFTYRAIGSH
jgi:hypothetical protein